jgi:hypothetical protein
MFERQRYRFEVMCLRLKQAALDIEQMFGKVLIEECDVRKNAEDKDIRHAVHELRKNKNARRRLEEQLETVQPDLEHVAHKALAYAVQLFHDTQRVPIIEFYKFHDRLFESMVKLVYLHPEIYTYRHHCQLHESITYIENLLQGLVYSEIPLVFEIREVKERREERWEDRREDRREERWEDRREDRRRLPSITERSCGRSSPVGSFVSSVTDNDVMQVNVPLHKIKN